MELDEGIVQIILVLVFVFFAFIARKNRKKSEIKKLTGKEIEGLKRNGLIIIVSLALALLSVYLYMTFTS